MRSHLRSTLFFVGVIAGSFTASAEECDTTQAASIGTYLGQVYCRGAYLLMEEGEPTDCSTATLEACQHAFKDVVSQKCPTADNQDLYQSLITTCERPMP